MDSNADCPQPIAKGRRKTFCSYYTTNEGRVTHWRKQTNKGAKMEHSQEIKQIAMALCEAQKRFDPLLKTSDGHNYKYADLQAVLDAVRLTLNQQGILINQTPSQQSDGSWACITVLLHTSGEWMRGVCPMILGGRMNGMQQFGSALTYARRYGLQAMVGIASEDDDGASAGEARGLAAKGLAKPFNAATNNTNRLALLMGWDALPHNLKQSPSAQYCLELLNPNGKHFDATVQTPGDMLARVQRGVDKEYEKLGGTTGSHSFKPTTLEALSALNATDTNDCKDLAALCLALDALRTEKKVVQSGK